MTLWILLLYLKTIFERVSNYLCSSGKECRSSIVAQSHCWL